MTDDELARFRAPRRASQIYAGLSSDARIEKAKAALRSVDFRAGRPAVSASRGALDSATGAEIMALFERLYQQGNTIALVTYEHDIARPSRDSHSRRKSGKDENVK
jgi:predicted ABC-type transport system involved in lysophospholipase L1 biosynthesis ATPase subunit